MSEFGPVRYVQKPTRESILCWIKRPKFLLRGEKNPKKPFLLLSAWHVVVMPGSAASIL
jgi:hypothetical protein